VAAYDGTAVLWVLAFDILLSEQPLHQQVETSSSAGRAKRSR